MEATRTIIIAYKNSLDKNPIVFAFKASSGFIPTNLRMIKKVATFTTNGIDTPQIIELTIINVSEFLPKSRDLSRIFYLGYSLNGYSTGFCAEAYFVIRIHQYSLLPITPWFFLFTLPPILFNFICFHVIFSDSLLPLHTVRLPVLELLPKVITKALC